MNKKRSVKKEYYQFGAAVLLLAVIFLFGGFGDVKNSSVSESVELGDIASLSPSGLSGGYAIPASAASSCVANEGASCLSGANSCGMTNSGSIQCGGSCSASTPSDSLCPASPVAFIDQSISLTEQGDPFTLTWGFTAGNPSPDCTVYLSIDGAPESPFSNSNSDLQILSPTTIATYVYRNECVNSAGSDEDSETHLVVIRPPDFSVDPGEINVGDPITFTWDCFSFRTSASGGGWSVPGNAVSGGPLIQPGPVVDTTYILQCSPEGSASDSVQVILPGLSILASPSFIQEGDSSNITWNASGVNSCEVRGPNGFSFHSPNPIGVGNSWSNPSGAVGEPTGPLAGQSIYTLTCLTTIGSEQERAIVNVNPIFEEI